MLGTIVNAVVIFLGAGFGLLFRKIIKKEICDSVLKVVGLVVLIFGLVGVINSMIYPANQEGILILKSKNDIVLLITLTVGTLIGELLKIDDHLNNFGHFIEQKLNKSHFSEAFINSSLIFCIGAMAIIGSVEAATGVYNTLYLKAIIDGITAIVLASTLGYGVIFSGFVVLLYQGFITLIAMMFTITPEFRDMFSMVGYVIVACIGLNFIRKDKIKIANMLPALLLVIIYYIIVQNISPLI